MTKQGFSFPRQVLLIEIERRCQLPDCEARNLIGLTKQEAIDYRGFACGNCKGWNDDDLCQGDIPDWWDEVEQAGSFQ